MVNMNSIKLSVRVGGRQEYLSHLVPAAKTNEHFVLARTQLAQARGDFSDAGFP